MNKKWIQERSAPLYKIAYIDKTLETNETLKAASKLPHCSTRSQRKCPNEWLVLNHEGYE
jgi:hypothetical protein